MKKYFRKFKTLIRLIKSGKSFSLILTLIVANLKDRRTTRRGSSINWTPKDFYMPGNVRLSLRIAVTAHIFYEDYVGKLFEYLNCLDAEYTLLVTTPFEKISEAILDEAVNLSGCKEVRVVICENRGRNFGPLLVEFGEELNQNFDIFLHVHSKKSLHGGLEQTAWSNHLYSSLLGDKVMTRQILTAFEQDSNLGLIYPTTYVSMPSWVNSWLKNFIAGKKWAERLGLKAPTSEFHIYPVGGMFWARTSALKQILTFSWAYKDFPEESGQLDNTTQHVIERLISEASNQNGMKSVFIHDKYLTEDRSFAWKDALSLNGETLHQLLLNCDTVSWDLFDTLIYRATGQPDYAKYQVGELLVSFGLVNTPLEYVQLRNAMENKLRQNLTIGCDVGLSEITSEIIHSQNWNIEAAFLENQEFAFDLAVFRPRLEIVKVYSHFAEKSLVISDTYYSEEQLVDIFEVCKIPVAKVLIASASNGRRKDRGDIWPFVRHKYIKNPDHHLHLGDNYVSDNQVPGDYGIRTCKIYSAKDINEILSKTRPTSFTLEEYVSNPLAKEISELNQRFFQNAFCLYSK